ncbi:MAG: YqaA family protein [Pseudomonadota bacterium]
MFDDLVLFGLAVSAFTSATLLPGTSEPALAFLVITGEWHAVILVAVASAANVAGSAVNWALGRGANRFRDTRIWPVSAKHQAAAESWYARYGWVSLLASWVPIVGDPLTLVAGVMREPLGRFLIVVGLAKTTRYAVVATIAQVLTYGF